MSRQYRKPTAIKGFMKHATASEQDALTIIWQNCGRTPFIWAYIRQFSESKLSTAAKLYNDGYIRQVGWCKAWGKPVKIWQLSDDIAGRLEVTYGSPAETTLEQCEIFLEDYTAKYNKYRRERSSAALQKAMA
jgi:hypothetical protein